MDQENSDPARITRIVSDNATFVCGVLRRLGVRPSDADDVAQRVFLTVLRRLSSIRPGAERSFLYAVALREAGHERRAYQRRREVVDDATSYEASSSVRPDILALRKQAHSSATAILEGMDDELRSVFVLFELQQKSSREVADLLNIPLGTAKSRLRRARQAFTDEALRRRAEPVS